MQSTSAEVCRFYASIVGDPCKLASGYSLIKQFLLTSQLNRESTLLNLLSPIVPILTLVNNVYPAQIFGNPSIPQQQKRQTRMYLLNQLTILYQQACTQHNTKTIQSLTKFVNRIHCEQGYSSWIDIYQTALTTLLQYQRQSMSQQTTFNVNPISMFMLGILQKADDRVNILSKHFLKLVMTEQLPISSQNYLKIIYYCLKPMCSMFGTDDTQLELYLNIFIPDIIKLTINNLQTTPTAILFGLKILTVLLAEYQVKCTQDILAGIHATCRYLLPRYLQSLDKMGVSETMDQEGNEQEVTIQIIIYQMLELLDIITQNSNMLDPKLMTIFAVCSTYLNQASYLNYSQATDDYLASIEDEGERTLRNKSIELLANLIEHNFYGKVCLKLLQSYVYEEMQGQDTLFYSYIEYNFLPLPRLTRNAIYGQSSLLILYSFWGQIVNNLTQVCATIGRIVQNQSQVIIKVLGITILNKLSGKLNLEDQANYRVFLRATVETHLDKIGLLLASLRGFSQLKDSQLQLSNPEGIPKRLIEKLAEYILSSDSSKSQSIQLILQFFLKLCTVVPNRPLLKEYLPPKQQLRMLDLYLHDGITSTLLVDLLATIADQQTILNVWQQILNRRVKDDRLPRLVAKWITNQLVMPREEDIVRLLLQHISNLEVIHEPVRAFIALRPPQQQTLIELLNKTTHQAWILPLLKHNLLFNAENLFLSVAKKIGEILTSQYEIQSNLLLPYHFIMSKTTQSLSLLQNQGIYGSFINKLMQYCPLFQGNHVRIVTSHILLLIAAYDFSLAGKVTQIIKGYGDIQLEQWQDEEGDVEDIVSRMLSCKMINQELEKELLEAFPDKSWDSEEVECRLTELNQALVNKGI